MSDKEERYETCKRLIYHLLVGRMDRLEKRFNRVCDIKSINELK